MSTFLSKLRLAVSENFDGIEPSDFDVRSHELSTEQLLAERRKALGVLQELARDDEAAHAAHQARLQRAAAEAFDAGRSVEVDVSPEKSPELLANIKKWQDRAGELGLPVVVRDAQGSRVEPGPGYVRDTYHARVRAIEAVLVERHGAEEPPAARALREKLKAARLAEWEPRERVRIAREKIRQLGALVAEGEVHAAVAELAKAQAATAAVEAEMRDAFVA